MRFLFIVQGEGRGHMTQAISLQNILCKNGHKLSKVIIGKSSRREIPDFFYKKIHCKIESIDSPNFVVGKYNKKIQILKSIFYNIYYLRRYLSSIRKINRIVKIEKPDVIINFYDILGGLFYLFYNPKIPFYCIGHQYLISHPEFIFPKGHKIDKFLLQLNNRITSFRANWLLALSFREIKNQLHKKLFVAPPLLRKEILEQNTKNENFIHGYILNNGYANEICDWHKQNRNVKAHFFWDKKTRKQTTSVHNNLSFHKIDDQKFIDYMRRCSGFATTAGFESICEAMYFGKPILMIPTAGHYEQKCNALDAKINGAGIISNTFDLDKLIAYIPNHKNNTSEFKHWVNQSEFYFNYILSLNNRKDYDHFSIHCDYLPNTR